MQERTCYIRGKNNFISNPYPPQITSERQTAPRVNLSANKKYYIEILQTVSDTDSLQIMVS